MVTWEYQCLLLCARFYVVCSKNEWEKVESNEDNYDACYCTRTTILQVSLRKKWSSSKFWTQCALCLSDDSLSFIFYSPRLVRSFISDRYMWSAHDSGAMRLQERCSPLVSWRFSDASFLATPHWHDKWKSPFSKTRGPNYHSVWQSRVPQGDNNKKCTNASYYWKTLKTLHISRAVHCNFICF